MADNYQKFGLGPEIPLAIRKKVAEKDKKSFKRLRKADTEVNPRYEEYEENKEESREPNRK